MVVPLAGFAQSQQKTYQQETLIFVPEKITLSERTSVKSAFVPISQSNQRYLYTLGSVLNSFQFDSPINRFHQFAPFSFQSLEPRTFNELNQLVNAHYFILTKTPVYHEW